MKTLLVYEIETINGTALFNLVSVKYGFKTVKLFTGKMKTEFYCCFSSIRHGAKMNIPFSRLNESIVKIVANNE